MIKNTYRIRIPYLYDPDHKGAHYSFDNGLTHCNGGDAHEIFTKDCKGYPPRKDGNTAYDIDSDIPELNASVKSSKATLVNKDLGPDLDTVLRVYFATVHSKLWIWAVKLEEDLVTYEMDRTEFEEFTRQWARYDINRKVVRYKSTSTIMIKWLEDRVLPGRAT
jgi:hypothetical protein